MKSKALKTGASFLVGLLIFLSVFYIIGLEKILYQLARLNLIFYSLSIGCIFSIILLWTLRWRLFVLKHNSKIPFFGLFKNLLVGLAINNLTPVARLGGEPIRAYLLKKEYEVKMRNGLATILSELTAEFIASVGVVIVSILLLTVFMHPPLWLYVIFVMFLILSIVGLLGIFGIYSKKRAGIRVIDWVTNKIKRIKPLRERILGGYKDFRKTFRRNLKNRKEFSKAMTISGLIKVFSALTFFFIFLALGYQIGLIQILIAIGVSFMLLSVPATPGSLGIFEGGLTSTFILLGIPAPISAAAVFLNRLVWFWGITIIGTSIGVHYGIDFSKSGGFGETFKTLKSGKK